MGNYILEIIIIIIIKQTKGNRMKKILKTIMVLCLMTITLNSFAKTADQMVGVVNINTAAKSEMILVPGIGASKADAIVSFRQNQQFKVKEDLLAVKGIGEKLLQKISSFVVVKGPTTLKGGDNKKN
ncbi:hypothetical protein BVY03_03590 [bacterium K02(2017)]|nr:hypothetical protein BVY03_03590 [bacterium K02(2017)]